MSTELIDRARAGDGDAFRQLTDPHRQELQVHCYRILGSVQDAEDALQDTLLAAWQGLGAFEERASIRTWLYRVATNRCLNAVRSASRRPRMGWPVPDVEPLEPTRLSEVAWPEPCPDVLLESVTSALKRARATLKRRLSPSGDRQPPPAPNSPSEAELAARLTRAYERGDVEGLVALLTDDVLVAMPPAPFEYQGRDLAAWFHSAVTFRQGRTYQLIPTRANGQLAFAAYLRDASGGPSHAMGLLVFTLTGDRIRAITRFDSNVLPRFGLPHTLPY